MIEKAFLYASEAHKGQKRKDGKPYISHPFSVAIELAKNGADDDLICAGLLHDVIEDAGASADEIRKTFGEKVAELVKMESEDKSLSWEQRKKDTFEILNRTKNKDFLMLVCADKLANIRDIKESLARIGDDAWSCFKRGKEKQKWLYGELVDALKLLDGLPMYDEFKQDVSEVFDLTGGKNGN